VSPTGGPKDVKAPLLRKRSLLDSALNFRGGTITFDFDEFLQLKDVQGQLIVTPLLKTNPKISVHKKRVSVKIEDSLLEKNTTYTISMGEAIQDLKEGNPYKNLLFTFSTGNYFDSLTLRGTVTEANTGRPDTASMVLLYPSGLPDSAFFSQKPMYIQKTETGRFTFRNLPKRNFTIYVLNDLNKNLQYDQQAERIAFHDLPVTPGDSLAVILYSFVEQDKPDTTKRKGLMRKGIEEKKTGNKISYTLNVDTINKTKRTFDISDSLQVKFDHVVKSFDATKFRLYQDEILDASGGISLDTSMKIISVNTQWTEDVPYKLILLKGFAQDSSGLQANGGEFAFRTKRNSDYGFLSVLIKQDVSDIVELIRNDKVVARKNASDTLISFQLLAPDNYQLRVLHDKNSNGKWDSGSFFGIKRQPELTELYPPFITVKANWENKIDLRNGLLKKPRLKTK